MADVTVNPYSSETDAAFLQQLLDARKSQLLAINVQSLSVSGSGFSKQYTALQIEEIKTDYRQLTERIAQLSAEESDDDGSQIRGSHTSHNNCGGYPLA